MTGRPDPTPENPPERITDWAAWSAAQMRALYPTRPADPTPDELHRYAVAWGHADAAILTDWRQWEQRYNDALEVIRAMSVRLDEQNAELDKLRRPLYMLNVDTGVVSLALTDAERETVNNAGLWVAAGHPSDDRMLNFGDQFTLKLLHIIARLIGEHNE